MVSYTLGFHLSPRRRWRCSRLTLTLTLSLTLTLTLTLLRTLKRDAKASEADAVEKKLQELRDASTTGRGGLWRNGFLE